MNKLLIFAGTTEGRELAEYMDRRGVSCDVCVATEYGETLIDESTTRHHIHAGRLTTEEMAELMRERQITHVVDATHPYAAAVSENIRQACTVCGCRYERLLRGSAASALDEPGTDGGHTDESRTDIGCTDETGTDGGRMKEDPRNQADYVIVASVPEAVDYLMHTEGAILAATGSKELKEYTRLPDYKERVFARVLSTPESVELAASLGFNGRNLICMQGPFSEDLNAAMLAQTGARYLVTKESGRSGGFPEKVRAARRAGAQLVVVGRPVQEAGRTPEEIRQLLDEAFPGAEDNTDTGDDYATSEDAPEKGCEVQTGASTDGNDVWGNDSAGEVAKREEVPQKNGRQRISLVGIGMGNPEQLTGEARRVIDEADLLVGASRMLEGIVGTVARPAADGSEATAPADGNGPAASEKAPGNVLVSYRPQEIAEYVHAHPQYRRIAVLLSGDPGFYSGAKGLREAFAGDEVRTVCGISSMVYLCGALGLAWEDVTPLSLHGRAANLIDAVRRHERTFAIVGKRETYQETCRRLIEYGLGAVTVHAGCRLSYPDEQIFSGTPQELLEAPVGDLCSLLIENADACDVVVHGLDDDAFRRSKVPMTKSEVRSISLSKLRLTRTAVAYDIGAGTGSIAIEMARMAGSGHVYAIEKKEEAASLIEENQKLLRAENLTLVRGLAPEALEDLPAPTHAFIGGSSGNMRQILEVLLTKNPQIRIVINAIALETVAETLECFRTLPVTDVDIASVSIGKSHEVGSYHMMMGQNPVYVMACTGCAQ